MKERLLVVGSVALDDLETRAGKRKNVLGGAATYIAIAASNFGPVDLVGIVGSDFPAAHLSMLERRGIDLTGLERVKGQTFHWSGVYADDFSSRQTIDTQLGVFGDFDPKLPAAYRQARFALLGNIHPALQLKVLDQLEPGAFVAADTMNLWIDVTPTELAALIGRVDLLVINDEEATQLSGEKQVIRAAEKVRAMGPKWLVIKRGEHGSLLFSDDEPFFTPALPLHEVIDPTGAGDSFVGGLMGYLASVGTVSAVEIKRGMRYGAAVASRTVEGFGADFLADFDRQGVEERRARIERLVTLG